MATMSEERQWNCLSNGTALQLPDVCYVCDCQRQSRRALRQAALTDGQGLPMCSTTSFTPTGRRIPTVTMLTTGLRPCVHVATQSNNPGTDTTRRFAPERPLHPWSRLNHGGRASNWAVLNIPAQLKAGTDRVLTTSKCPGTLVWTLSL